MSDPNALADHFNSRYPDLNWTGEDVSEALKSFEPELESIEEHLEVFADHQTLVQSTEQYV